MNEKLLKYLVQEGLLTQLQADELWKEHISSRRPVRELVLELGAVPEDRVIEALSAVSGLPTVRLYENPIPMEVQQMVRPDLLRTHLVLPFALDPADNRTLFVATNDPMNMRGRDAVAAASRRRIRLYLATSTDILRTIDRYFGSEEMQEAAEQYTRANETDRSLEEQILQEDVNSSPVVVLVTSLVEQAVRQRASDIHIEAGPDRVRVRCRVDGILYQTATYDQRLLSAIVARVKIISGMDISEKRKPQDGRFSITVDRREYDVRVSTLPTVYGEKCVMRLAQKKALSRSKSALGLSGDDLEKFDHILKKPNGIVLVTGPTGSGKSTTLYTALSELNSDTVNIVTVEDPVEANIEGVNQVQVNPKADLTFANALRSILRQDPDIIMIGEIRDSETASIAVQASITGHLVVSTLHTNDTASSITRLLDMGIESYLIADATVGIIAQRLVRRLCPDCKKARPILEHEAEYLELPREKRSTALLCEPVGCQRCGGTGYYDRIGVYEIMEITPTLRSMIAKRCSADELRQAAINEGMHTMRESAKRLVLEGITSLSELQRISMEDQNEVQDEFVVHGLSSEVSA
ncbi:GspE/PulE family protein [Intestinimonas massiliensis (ex Afouda et al. 2020)]|uniref:GspE/PulE family protein n=1 Tax=Intestinimonas massiliensis (ex Afouda et al. 2020) TaxID=1673721 RepID=UPI0010318037|nr:GspE/PulE family protein [Intestinimonas massiliensis (ex Afouda et al. 2020)]